MRSLLTLAIAVPLSFTFAQQIPPEKEPVPEETPQLKEVVPPKERMTKNVLILADISGSMRANQELARAFAFIEQTLEQATDEMRVGVLAFGTTHERWIGVPEPEAPEPVPEGWALFPSKEAVEKAMRFLQETWLGDEGTSTCIGQALIDAMRDKTDDLTILVVSDGVLSDFADCGLVHEDGVSISQGIPNILPVLQKERKQAGLKPAVIMCLGIGSAEDSLKHLGEEGNGGYWLRSCEPKPTFSPHWIPQLPPLPPIPPPK